MRTRMKQPNRCSATAFLVSAKFGTPIKLCVDRLEARIPSLIHLQELALLLPVERGEAGSFFDTCSA